MLGLLNTGKASLTASTLLSLIGPGGNMQVFLPYPDLERSVRCLDPKRLGNQIYREAKTLITGGWPNHPAAKIWANHRKALAEYALFGLRELSLRGYHYTKWFDFFEDIYYHTPGPFTLPPIIGHEPFHAGHRAALLAKSPEWYSQFGWTETPEPDTKKAYIWSLPE